MNNKYLPLFLSMCCLSESVAADELCKSTLEYIYVTNEANNTVSTCPLEHGGIIGACTSSNPGSTFSGPSSILVNPTGSLAYVTNYNSNAVSYCPIDNSGTLQTCTSSGGIFNGPSGVAINSSSSFGYVTNFNSNTVSGCTLNSDGSFNTCTSYSDPSFQFPNSIIIDDGNVYVTNSNTSSGSVSICPINPDNSLGACTVDSDSTFHGSAGLAADRLGRYAYVVNGSNLVSPQTVSVCPIQPNGSLGSCAVANSTLFQGVNFGKITVNRSSTRVFLANQYNNYLVSCSIMSNGNLTRCMSLSDPSFDNPQGVAISQPVCIAN